MANERHIEILASLYNGGFEYIKLSINTLGKNSVYYLHITALELLQSEHDKEIQVLKQRITQMDELIRSKNETKKRYRATIRLMRGEIEELKQSLQTHLNNNH